MNKTEASEMIGALEILKCLQEEFSHLENQYRGRAKQREAEALVYARQNLIEAHMRDIVGKLELMKSEALEKAN